MLFEPPDKKLAITMFLALALAMTPILALNTSEEPPNPSGDEFYLVQGNSIKAQVIPAWFKPQIYGTLIGCVEYYESNTGLYGDRGYNCKNVLFESEYCAFGCLMFWQQTFKHYCIDTYKLPNDIMNCEIQKLCADLMIQDRWNNVYHWSTAHRCL